MSIDVRPPGGLGAASALPDPTNAIAAPWFPPVTQQIAAIAERMPDSVAIEDPQGTVTYAELWRAGERLALRLQGAGVESDNRVAIAGVRSTEFVIAMIAVLRAGAIAVPIDASLPPIRRSAMLEESGVRFALSIQGAPDDAAIYAESGITHIPGADPANGNGAVARLPPPRGAAYIYFTSGSTGVPKGILGTHQGLGQFVSWQRERFAIGPGDRVALLKGISFDAVLREVFTPLTSGATICIPPDAYEPDQVLPWVVDQRVTILHATPSHADVWLAAAGDALPKTSLRYVFFSGEILNDAMVGRWRQSITPPGAVVNLYGPTEITMIRTYHVVEEDAEPGPQPVGFPLPHSQALVVAEDDRLCAPGERGEILLRTPYRTAGYVNASSDEVFVQNPFRDDPDDIVYRTGDVGMIRDDGTLVVTGRLDDQVQILGVRVEPGEVAAHLQAHPGVRTAAVIAQQREGNVPYLVAFVVPDSAPVEGDELRRFLADRLIGPMIPNRFVPVAELPMTVNGKVDAAALLASDTESDSPEPPTSLQERIAALPREQRATLMARLLATGDDHSEPEAPPASREALQDRLTKLSPAQRSALTTRLRSGSNGVEGDRDRPALGAALAETHPLSFAQERLWFLDRFNPGSPFYNVCKISRFLGPLDLVAFQTALDALAARHDVLRTRYLDVEGSPRQVVDQPAPVDFTIVDLSHLPRAQRDPACREAIDVETARPFDLATGPIWRAKVFVLGGEEHVVVLTMHHIACDGWSFPILAGEVSEIYAATLGGRPVELSTLPMQYADYARWQRDRLAQGELDTEAEYWQHQLGGSLPVLELPTDRLRPPIQTSNGASREFTVRQLRREDVAELAAQTAASPFMVGLALYAAFLHRYGNTDDVIIGVPSADRSLPDAGGLIGFFVNTLALRTVIDDAVTFRDLITRVRATALAAYANQEVPFEQVVQRVLPERDPSRSPVFQTMFTYGMGEFAEDFRLPSVVEEAMETDLSSSKFDLEMGMRDVDGRLGGIVIYNTDLFEPTTIERMVRHFGNLARAAFADPDRPISEMPLLDDEEAAEVLHGFAGSLVAVEPPSVVEAIAGFAATTPHHLAVVSGQTALTYQQLHSRAGRVAALLHRVGVGRGDRVAVMMEPSVDLIAVLLGTLYCGAAYVPVDPALPDERIRFILDDAGPAAFFVDQVDELDWASALPGKVLSGIVGDDGPVAAAQIPAPSEAAYVIYTSGSTGRPKGVVVHHGALATLVASTIGYYGLHADDRLLQFHSFSFDASVEEIFATLAAGARLVLRSVDMLGSATRVLAAAGDAGITVLEFPTAYWHELATELLELDVSLPSTVRMVITGGEAARPQLVAAWKRRYDGTVTLINGYGPTEVTVTATVANLSEIADPGHRYVTIGRPFPGTLAYVLDRRRQPVPVGIPGELYLGGTQVASGYLNRPELTAERFVDIPNSLNGRVYRTGDQVRWRPDGNLEYLGRIDRQVKVRGYRVEIGEIESVLLEHPDVAEAAVVPISAEGSDHGLAAMVVGTVEVDDLRRFAARRLPGYMIPSTIEIRDTLPRLIAGKIDVQSLLASDDAPPAADPAAPDDPVVARLCEIWGDLLRRPVGPHDNFFMLGGHSLLAVRLFSLIEQEWQISMPISALFQAPTPIGLASELNGHIEDTDARENDARSMVRPPVFHTAAPPHRPRGRIPLSYSQRRLWFLDQLHPGLPVYHVDWGVRLHGSLHRGALQAAFDALVGRHEVLRTRFLAHEGVPYQVIDPPGPVPIRYDDLRSVGSELREERMQAILSEDGSRSFDLASDLMLRVTLVRLADDEYGLLVVAHHIAVDADSFDILKQELAEAYRAHLRGEMPDLRELPIQYAEVATRQRDQLASAEGETALDHWVERLAGAPPVLALPATRPRPRTFTYRGDWVRFRVPGEASGSLAGLAAAEGATPFMTLLAGLSAMLQRYTGETDILVGAPGTERTSVETEALIGFFVNTLPLRTDASGDPSFRTLLGRVRATMLDALAYRDVPFEAIVERVQPPRDPSRSPLIQVMCAMAHGDESRFTLPLITSVPLRAGSKDRSTKFDLTVYGFMDDGPLEVSVGFYADAYERTLMEQFGAHFRRLLEAAALQPDVPISRLDLFGPGEQRWLLSGLNQSATPFPSDRTIPEVFREVVARHEADVAISERGRTMTYRELSDAADALAARLRDSGVKPGHAVGLEAERSTETIVAMLGILEAGAYYVPLDPTYPAERLEFTKADVGVRAIVSLGRDGFGVEAIEAEEPADFGEAVPAYVMYTSGSTGRPKGVAIPHRAILRLVWDADYAQLGPDDVVAHASNTAFDAATWEVWGALLNGARIEVLDGDTLTSPGTLAAELADRGVTAMFVTTALFNIIAKELPDAFRSLNHLLFGGEAVDPDAVARVLRAARPRRLVHVYGPTETTTFASWHEVTSVPATGETVPIGLPIVNTTLHVLDEHLNPVPIGVAGELHIGGDGLALGYVGDADLTRQKFVADPRDPGSRLYRTGDRVRRRTDGSIEFVGRIDRQIKLRGFRIEPGEVEAHLLARPGIASAIIRVWRRNGDARLVAYVVPETGAEVAAAGLQEELRYRLPDHMVPAHVTVLDRLPLNPNGKVDTSQLPEPEEHHVASYVAPHGPAMVRMAELWRTVLRAEQVGAADSFFDLGGHSLLAVELMAAVETSFGKAVPLSTLFDAPTLEAFTARVAGHDDTVEADLIVPIQPNGARPPLFCFHPGGGNVFHYQPLARHLPADQPVLGIQAQGADGRSRPHRTVEAMAAEYVEVIKRAQPEGPYHLLGWSLGGLIAFETARRLDAEGERVALLALLDTSFPRPSSFLDRQRSYFDTLRRDGVKGVGDILQSVWSNTRIALGKLRHGPRWGYYLLRRKPIPPLLAGKRLTHIGLAANERYRPRPYPGAVTYFRATGPNGTWARRPDLAWRDVAAGVDMIDVPGAHSGPGSMIDEPHLPVLAAEVEARLATSAVPEVR